LSGLFPAAKATSGRTSSGEKTVFISKSVREETDKKLKRLKAEMEREGRRMSESELIDEGVERIAEDMGMDEVFEDDPDDFMDIFE